MLEFIIYDEDIKYQEKNKKIIDNIMMNRDEEYLITPLKLSICNWMNLLNKDTFKINILDIKSRKNSGLSIAKYIREELFDWQSMIIFTSITNDFKYDLVNYRLLQVDYINKNDSYDKRLDQDIKIALNNFDKRPNALKYKYKNTEYNISFSKIIYIEKEKDSKKCLIKTTTGNYYCSGNLKKIEEKLDKRFIKCNKSYIINLEQVEYYNTKENIITFKNQETLNFISRSKRKEIINFLRDIL